MNRFLPATALLLAATGALAQQSATPASPDDLKDRCRQGAEYMIQHGEKTLIESSASTSLTERRRKLLEYWKARIARGDDPCQVLDDIFRAAMAL